MHQDASRNANVQRIDSLHRDLKQVIAVIQGEFAYTPPLVSKNQGELLWVNMPF